MYPIGTAKRQRRGAALQWFPDKTILASTPQPVNIKTHICELREGAGDITRLRELRLQSGRTQETVAKKLDVTQAAVSRWESGETTPLRKYRKRLARLYGVTEEELMRGEDTDASGKDGAG